MSVPSPPLPGTTELSETHLRDLPFEPTIDLIADGTILATLFYDDKPECAYAEVDLEGEHGDVVRVPGAAAGLDEDEVGWCLQFTDDPYNVSVICRMPPSWQEHALGCAWVLVAARVAERGLWEPLPEFRLWGPVMEDGA
jgi:hypothetical protein